MLQTVIDRPIIGVMLLVVFLISITIHEFSHAYVSNRLGDPTPRQLGRLTLNPVKHLDFLGTILIFAAGFGWAKPVPINPNYYKDKRQGTMLTSIAGPLSNLILGFLFTFPYYLLLSRLENQTNVSDFYINMVTFFNLFIILNTNLAILNLLPVPPLDGSKILGGILPEKQYAYVLKHERQIGFILIILVFATNIISKIIYRISVPIQESFYKIAALILN